jgi:hypothetical protein
MYARVMSRAMTVLSRALFFSSCLVRTFWIESSDDTGDLQPRYLVLAVPDPSGKVRTSFDTPGTRLWDLAPRCGH